MLKLLLFGNPCCQQDGLTVHLPRRKCLALLAYLALNPRSHSRAELATLLNPDSVNAHAYLRRTLSEIRHNLGAELFRAENGVQLVDNELAVDVLEFKKLVRPEDDSAVDEQVIADWHMAISLYSADFMAGFSLQDAPAFDEWQFFQGESLRHTLATTLQKLVAWHISRHEFEESIGLGRRWLALDPLHEPAQRELMRIYAAAGMQAAALRQYDECTRLLLEELGVTPDEKTRTLYDAIRARQWTIGEGQSMLLRSVAPRHNLPPSTTPFIGRQKEIVEISQALGNDPECRLLTIVGQGGVGKTRLALEVGRQLQPVFMQGAGFVSLVAVSSRDNLASAIATALNLQFVGRLSPREQLLNYLRQQHLLLILDNFEQLIAGVDLLTDILSNAPQIKLLVTSRDRLNVQPEWVYDLAGLTYPDQEIATDPIEGQLATYSALALFVQRARQARATFRPTQQNWPAIVRICQLVEGMPLGLELAASWIPVMSCQEIGEGIARNLDFLTTTLQDVPDRHRSLPAVFQHSWSLLTADEKAVLGKLSIFQGGFTREAAEQVTGTVLLPLAGLVRKSLITRGRNGRYMLHELLRQFAAEKLARSPNVTDITHLAHATYFAAFLQQRENDLWGNRQFEALNEIAADLENIRQGWQWAIDRLDVSLLNRAATTLFFFYDMRGHIQEGERIFRLAALRLQSTAPTSPMHRLALGKLLTGQGWFSAWTVSFVTCEECLNQAATWFRSVEPPALQDLSLALNYLGLIQYFRGKLGLGEAMLQESLMLARETGFRPLIGRSLFNLGQTAILEGEYRRAEPYLEEASRLFGSIGEQHRRSLVLNRLGEVAQRLGEYDKAASCLQESLVIRQQLGDRTRIPAALQELGILAYKLGDYDRAEELVQEGLAINQQTGNLFQIGEDYKVLGWLALAGGNLTQAEKYLQKSLAIFREMGIHIRQTEVLNSLARLALDRREHEKVQRFLSEALALSQDYGNVARKASTLLLWGEVKLHEAALNEVAFHEAAQYYYEALEAAIHLGAAPLALAICLSAARLYMPPYGNDTQRAVSLLQLALNHAAAEAQTRERAKAMLLTLAPDFPLPATEERENLWTAVAELRDHLAKR